MSKIRKLWKFLGWTPPVEVPNFESPQPQVHAALRASRTPVVRTLRGTLVALGAAVRDPQLP